MNTRKNPFTIAEILLCAILQYVMVVIPCTHYFCLYVYQPASLIAAKIYMAAVFTAAAIPVAALSIGGIKAGRLEKLLGLMCAVVMLCVFAADNNYMALTGTSRNEGGVMLLCYYVFFFGARFVAGQRARKFLLNIFLGVGAAHCIYGLCQFFDVGNGIYDSYHYAISGVTGNPNFMGSLTVLLLGVAVGMARYSRNIFAKAVYFALCALVGVTLLLTKTVSAYVGAVAVAAVMAVLILSDVACEKGRKTAMLTAGGIALAAVTVTALALAMPGSGLAEEISAVVSQLQNFVATGTVDEGFASGRVVIWINCIKLSARNLLTGVGIDNLMDPFHMAFGLVNGQFVDKAHNELLNVLVTMGLPALLCYLALYLQVFRDGITKIKTKENRAVNAALLAAFTGYVVQGMFNISVIDVAPYFWIIAGLLARPVTKKE